MFIKQIFFGILRYKNFLKIFIDELFLSKSSSIDYHDEKLSLEDYKSLIIVSYILYIINKVAK